MRQDDLVAEIRPPLLKIMARAGGPLEPIDLQLHVIEDVGEEIETPKLKVVKTSAGPLAAIVDLKEYVDYNIRLIQELFYEDGNGVRKCRRCGARTSKMSVHHAFVKRNNQPTVPIWEAGDCIVYSCHVYCSACDEMPDVNGPPILQVGARDNRPH